MSKYSNLRRFAAIGALSLMAATQASAHSLAAVTAAGNFTFAAGTATLPGMTTPLFFNPAGARFIATFSSECSVNAAAGNSNAYTDVDIVVLNPANVVVAVLSPTAGNQDAFCSANGTAGFDGFESNSVQAIGGTNLAAGNYRVQVRARTNAGATGGWFGERALILYR